MHRSPLLGRLLARRGRAIPHAAAPRRAFTQTAARHAEVEIFVNGKPVKIEQGTALIQACEKAGAVIPRFCYHDRLSVAGNCRMCLVEVEKVPKPVASCAFPVNAGMKVHTETAMVHKAREGVMEFLLSNHPLDCPVCDQGGECDLQDQSVRYGSDRGRFREFTGKRAVEDKDFGPLVKTEMTRCIHCTRCVRFANEFAGAEELGTSGRGNDMQIGMYVEKAIQSELSGNIIDLCPVGALTSKPYEFKSRPWELKKTESVDVMDAVGSHIRVDSRGQEVMRVLPRLSEEINEEWINDKTRFAYDGLKRQRLTSPMMRAADGTFAAISWKEALQKCSQALSAVDAQQISAVGGQLADAESMVALKDLFARLRSANLRTEGAAGLSNSGPAHGVDFRSNYILNSRLAGVEGADALLLVGTNPRHEAAIFNLRVRKAYLRNNLMVGLVGAPADLTYEYEHISTNAGGLEQLLTGKSAFAKTFAAAKRPMVVVGSGLVDHADARAVFSALPKLVQKFPNLMQADWNGVNVLQRNASQTAANDIGFAPSHLSTPLEKSKVVYLLGADGVKRSQLPQDAFIIYQGHHGDVAAHFANIILPGAAYTEKSATYVNTEGRSQITRAAVSPPGAAREDWKIIRALSEVLGMTLPYDDVHGMRERLSQIAPHLTQYGLVEQPAFVQLGLRSLATTGSGKKAETFSGQPLSPTIADFYLTDPISRASATMAKCSVAFTNKKSASTEAISATA